MPFTTFMTWIVVAVVTGWAAGIVVKNGGHGTKADVLLAAGGSLASAGAAFALQRKFFYPSLG